MSEKPNNYAIYSPEEIKPWEEAYNAMARVWNSLPGSKLVWPQDRFTVKYCECRRRGRTREDERGVLCYGCGFYIIGE